MNEKPKEAADAEAQVRGAMVADETEFAHLQRELAEIRQLRPMLGAPPVTYSTLGACSTFETVDAFVR